MGPVIIGFIFSLLVSACFTFIEREKPRDRVIYFVKLFCYFFLAILAFGWFMSIFPR